MLRINRRRCSVLSAGVLALVGWFCVGTAYGGPDDAHRAKGREIAAKAIEYLRTQQDATTGGWAVPDQPDGPHLPGISGLVLHGMLMEPGVDVSDSYVERGVNYLMSHRREDGGIYDRILPNYNTALALSALARVDRGDVKAAIPDAQQFLRGLQWAGQLDDDGEEITRSHTFYGGAGYGSHSRPDNSNLQLMLEGLHDSGLDSSDEAFQRAIVFLERTQMLDEVNDQPYADGSTQGGFIYATGPEGNQQGIGESKAGTIQEVVGGERFTRLRCYGSMTYAGFKSYLYADLNRDDIRVRSALDWIRRHYTLEENPGVGMQGYYYYLVTFSRALHAWGEAEVTTLNADGSVGTSHNWANDLIDRLASLQRADGSFINTEDRWMEGNPTLVTAYALVAVQYALDSGRE